MTFQTILLKRVALKHISLGVRPNQYTIVHENPMWAIVDVLGDAATPEVAAVWDEVYWLMANLLINKERGLYSAVDLNPDEIWRTWGVVERRKETADTVAFVVKRTNPRPTNQSLPEPYVSLKMIMKGGVHQLRQHSPTAVDDGDHRQFAVKRVRGIQRAPDGEMSNLLHDTVKVGDRVQLAALFGDVVLNYSNRPLVLASAGIGLTPMEGMPSHKVKSHTHRKVQLLHADGDSGSYALRRQVEDSLAQLNEGKPDVWFERAEGNLERNENSGYMNIDNVDLPEDAEYYLCGPLAFMKLVRSALIARGIPAKDIQYEVFGPDL
ncbi:hemin transporter [Glutamicibacter ardleyensis]|uniref:hemin transporter n=2 Tax=Glutamicibacter ardleyensis TaxID=225894 RepID=UPI003FD5B20D